MADMSNNNRYLPQKKDDDGYLPPKEGFDEPEVTIDSNSYKNNSTTNKNKCKQFVLDNLLMLLTMCGIVVGFALGLGLRPLNISGSGVMWLGFPGELFLRMLKACIIPLIVPAVITATATLDPKQNGRISGLMLGYIAVSNLLSAFLGVLLAATIKPGNSLDGGESDRKVGTQLNVEDIIADLIRNIFPDNLIRATLQQVYTSYTEIEGPNYNESMNITDYVMKRGLSYSNSTNVLGLICMSAVFGMGIAKVPEKGKPFLAFFQSLLDVVVVVLGWITWITPFGVASLIAVTMVRIDDLGDMFAKVGMFTVAALVGLLGHQLVLLPLIHLVIVRTNPLIMFAKFIKAWLVAFATASKAAALPFTLDCMDRLGIDSRISSFCVPIGLALNKNGSAIFIAVSTIFLGQLAGHSLSVVTYILIGVLAFCCAYAIPPVPSASIVTVTIICSTLNIPVENIGLLFSVEWLLDRVRTAGNAVGDLYGIGFTWCFMKNVVRKHDKLQNEYAHPDVEVSRM